jgi:metallo-beta-lactamase family protein
VESLQSFSAHADQSEILRWLRGFERAPRQTYVVHGEPAAAQALAAAIETQLGWKTHVACDGEQVALA